jgi:hypothetical protein
MFGSMSTFEERTQERFPGAVAEIAFVKRTLEALRPHGFSKRNAIACVGVCRDELCRSMVWTAKSVWGEAFNFSSLGGLLTLGTAGFRAAHSHAPIVAGKERYVYITMPHIGISADGELGKCVRKGRHGSSAACGALTAIHEELSTDSLSLTLDHDNIEYSLIKQELLPYLHRDQLPDMGQLTKAMATLIRDELERYVELTVDTSKADYAVFTGIQIHCPVEGSIVWVDRAYACVDGSRHNLAM